MSPGVYVEVDMVDADVLFVRASNVSGVNACTCSNMTVNAACACTALSRTHHVIPTPCMFKCLLSDCRHAPSRALGELKNLSQARPCVHHHRTTEHPSYTQDLFLGLQSTRPCQEGLSPSASIRCAATR